MRVTHRLNVTGVCPVDEKVIDRYRVVVRTDRLIAVEDILAAIETLTAAPIFQEDLTVKLANLLGAEVVTVGFHSGVETEVIA